MAFATAAMTMSAETLFGCSALTSDLPCGPILLEETLAFMSSSVEQHGSPPLEVLARHCKDPFPPWRTRAELSRQCREILTSLDPLEVPAPSLSSAFARLIFVGIHRMRVLPSWSSLRALVLVWRQFWRPSSRSGGTFMWILELYPIELPDITSRGC